MFWLSYVRDFYRAGQAPAVNYTLMSRFATVAYSESIRNRPAVIIPTPQQAPSLAQAAIHHAAITETSQDVPPMGTYLQRLSIEGDHAFGVWDPSAGFSVFSANFERITGLFSGECAAHDWIHSIHADQQYALNEALLAAQAGSDGRCLVQAASPFHDAAWRWVLIDIKAPTLRQPQTMALFRDVSEAQALEATLKQMESALAISDRGRSAFLSSMSHELRTPLNAIMGFSEMMKSGVFGPLDNPTYQQYARDIHNSGATLLNKINDLLDIASMDAGGLEIEESEFSLTDLLAEVIEIHSHHAFTRNQQLKLDCPSRLIVSADRAKLLCSVSHLVANALRHSKDNADIAISTRISPDDGLILSVRDTGEGIAPKQLDIIRTALEADVAYFNIECGGIGLGLSLAKELTTRHGGKVMLDSIRHRGTVVSLILPTSRVLSGLPQKRKRSSETIAHLSPLH